MTARELRESFPFFFGPPALYADLARQKIMSHGLCLKNSRSDSLLRTHIFFRDRWDVGSISGGGSQIKVTFKQKNIKKLKIKLFSWKIIKNMLGKEYKNLLTKNLLTRIKKVVMPCNIMCRVHAKTQAGKM